MVTHDLTIDDCVAAARDRNRTPAERASMLAQAFHSLREADGVVPFDAERLDEWACGPAATNASRLCAAFVLEIYNQFAEWQCGPFRIAQAVSTWDQDNLLAFQFWAMQPFTL